MKLHVLNGSASASPPPPPRTCASCGRSSAATSTPSLKGLATSLQATSSAQLAQLAMK